MKKGREGWKGGINMSRVTNARQYLGKDGWENGRMGVTNARQL